MKSSIGINFIIILSFTLGLTGCGGGDSSTSNLNNKLTPTDVNVERGPVYEAKVIDSSGKIAIQKIGKNIYSFSDTPIYPITVSGGWIDLDGNGIKDNDDIVLDINLTSYSNNITPITTLCSNPNKSKRDELEAKFAQDLGISILELKNLPSKAIPKVAILTNAIFKEVKKNNTTIEQRFNYDKIFAVTNNSTYTKLMTEYKNIKIIAESSDGMINGIFDARKLEQYIINKNSNLFTTVQKEKNNSSLSNENNKTNNINIYDITWKNKGYNEIVSPHTGKTWLDRNLGASKICETLNDKKCIGDYYQWGRLADGHEKINSNWTTKKLESTDSLSNSNFYKAYFGGDWLNNNYKMKNRDSNGIKRSKKWSKTDGTAICPINYRVPSSEELKAETVDLGIDEPTKLLNSFLKIIPTGKRTYHPYIDYKNQIFLWSKSLYYGNPEFLHYYDYRPQGGIGVGGLISNTETNSFGMPIRCIKD